MYLNVHIKNKDLLRLSQQLYITSAIHLSICFSFFLNPCLLNSCTALKDLTVLKKVVHFCDTSLGKPSVIAD